MRKIVKVRERMDQLAKEIKRHRKLYYYDAKPEISDEEFDAMFNELVRLERKYPKLRRADSPTKSVGHPATLDSVVAHDTPMLSLKAVYDEQAVRRFVDQAHQASDGQVTFVCEPKVDGMAMELIYINGKLHTAVTRGDGQFGEDVTSQVRQIPTVPAKITTRVKRLVVRGEICMSYDNLESITGFRDYSSPRSAVSGMVRSPNARVENLALCIFTPFGVADTTAVPFDTHMELMRFFEDEGFVPFIRRYVSEVSTADEIIDALKNFKTINGNLSYPTDGMVIKVNEFAYRFKLGETSAYPRWAIAFKVNTMFATTEVLDIRFTVGRSGKLTPVAHVASTRLGDSIVSKVSMGSCAAWLEKDVAIGDVVKMQRSGDVIPYIVGVERVGENRKEVAVPIECPVCHTPVRAIKNSLYCVNDKCQKRLIDRLHYALGRNGFNVKGFGIIAISRLVEAGILTVSDVFEAADDSVEFEDILDCSSTVAFKLIARLSIARNIDMDKLICSFGAPKIGPSISMQIARSIKSIEQLAEMTEEALLAAVNGNKNSRRYAKSFAKFFGSEDVKTELNRLISCGVTTEKTAAGILSGYTVVLTGKFTTKRSELEDVVKRHGGSISPIIKNNTKLLIEGEKPSLAKIKRATELNVSILSEKELKELLS